MDDEDLFGDILEDDTKLLKKPALAAGASGQKKPLSSYLHEDASTLSKPAAAKPSDKPLAAAANKKPVPNIDDLDDLFPEEGPKKPGPSAQTKPPAKKPAATDDFADFGLEDFPDHSVAKKPPAATQKPPVSHKPAPGKDKDAFDFDFEEDDNPKPQAPKPAAVAPPSKPKQQDFDLGFEDDDFGLKPTHPKQAPAGAKPDYKQPPKNKPNDDFDDLLGDPFEAKPAAPQPQLQTAGKKPNPDRGHFDDFDFEEDQTDKKQSKQPAALATDRSSNLKNDSKADSKHSAKPAFKIKKDTKPPVPKKSSLDLDDDGFETGHANSRPKIDTKKIVPGVPAGDDFDDDEAQQPLNKKPTIPRFGKQTDPPGRDEQPFEFEEDPEDFPASKKTEKKPLNSKAREEDFDDFGDQPEEVIDEDDEEQQRLRKKTFNNKSEELIEDEAEAEEDRPPRLPHLKNSLVKRNSSADDFGEDIEDLHDEQPFASKTKTQAAGPNKPKPPPAEPRHQLGGRYSKLPPKRPPTEDNKNQSRLPKRDLSAHAHSQARARSGTKAKHNDSALSYASRPTLASILEKHRGAPTIASLLDENQALHNQLKYFNQKLTRMIDYRGFNEAVTRVRTGKQQQRGDSKELRLKNLAKEASNNDKHILIQREDLRRLERKKERLVNPAYLAELNTSIQSRLAEITQLKKIIHDLEIENWRELRGGTEKSKARRKGTTSTNHITALMKEIELVAKKNEELRSQIRESHNHMREQAVYLKESVEDKKEKLKTQMKLIGLVEETEHTAEYRKVLKEISDFRENEHKLDTRNEKTVLGHKKELEEITLEHQMVEKQVDEISKAIEKQTAELFEMIELAKSSQSAHGVKILERIKEGIEPSGDRSRSHLEDPADPHPLNLRFHKLANPSDRPGEQEALRTVSEPKLPPHKDPAQHLGSATDRNHQAEAEALHKNEHKASKPDLRHSHDQPTKDSSPQINESAHRANHQPKSPPRAPDRDPSPKPGPQKDPSLALDGPDVFQGFGEEVEVSKPKKPDLVRKSPFGNRKDLPKSPDPKDSEPKLPAAHPLNSSSQGNLATPAPAGDKPQPQKGAMGDKAEDLLGLDFFPEDKPKQQSQSPDKTQPAVPGPKPAGPVKLVPSGSRPGLVKPGGPGGPPKLPASVPKPPIKISTTNNPGPVQKLEDVPELLDVEEIGGPAKPSSQPKPLLLDDDDEDFNGFGSDVPDHKPAQKNKPAGDAFGFLEEDTKPLPKKTNPGPSNTKPSTQKDAKKQDFDDLFAEDPKNTKPKPSLLDEDPFGEAKKPASNAFTTKTVTAKQIPPSNPTPAKPDASKKEEKKQADEFDELFKDEF